MTELAENGQEVPQEVPGSIRKIYVLTGLVVVILGNVLAIFTYIGNIGSYLQQFIHLDAFFELHATIRYVIITAIEAGFGLIGYWHFLNFYKALSRKYKIASVSLFISGILTIWFVGTAISPPSERGVLREQMRQYTSTILAQQTQTGDDRGGFRFSLAGVGTDTQSWTTAQCVTALLTGNAVDFITHRPARDAFAYLERTRLDEKAGYVVLADKTQIPAPGWGYYRGAHTGVTEINSWVILAKLASFQPRVIHKIWPGKQLRGAIVGLQRDVTELVGRQNADGGWGPIPKTDNARHDRTYSTLMAVWALLEARRSAILNSAKQHDQNIELGLQWLLNHYQSGNDGSGGWWPNPAVPNQGKWNPGLTAQTLYVISDAEPDFPSLSANPRLTTIRTEFFGHALSKQAHSPALVDFAMEDNQAAHDTDGYLGLSEFYAEPSTFLWYPWTLATASLLTNNSALLSTDQDRASALQRNLVNRSGEFAAAAGRDQGLYPTAEGMYAIEVYLSQAADKP